MQQGHEQFAPQRLREPQFKEAPEQPTPHVRALRPDQRDTILAELQRAIGFRPLNYVSEIIRSLRYDDMMHLARELNADIEGVKADSPEALAAWLHRWSKKVRTEPLGE